MTLRSIAVLAFALLICLGVGFLGSLSTAPEIPTWYAGLVKPSWTPPPQAFPIVWTALYILMAIALWRLWTAPPTPERRRALVAFAVQLILNAAWSPVFFALHATTAALAIIAALLAATAVTIALSLRVDRAAALLLVPYLAWLAYASTLNAGIVVLN